MPTDGFAGLFFTAREDYSNYQRVAERELLELRRRLREHDADAPESDHDGNAWFAYLFGDQVAA